MRPDPTDTDLLFARALELDPEARREYLDELTRALPAKAAEVRSLLGAVELAEPDFLERPPMGAFDVGRPKALGTGSRVGPYLLREELGRGGMGVVFRAERVEGGFSQEVAIKVARWGLDEDHLKRFDSERTILARLGHAGIARLYGGGVVAGRPYLVMELVEGLPITEYVARERLPVIDVVGLLRNVCDAVAAAHRSLVIHRDLKPSNVLVTRERVVKLLDFGVSKLLDSGVESGLRSTHGHTRVAMTPAYSAPEQVALEPVSTATDVFALGVVLYESLTGLRPFDVDGRSPADVQRIISESEPEAPSVVARRSGRPSVPADLDAVVSKALSKAPEDRYGSAHELSVDLGRFLDGGAVSARPPTRVYRLSKLVRRNRVPVLSALAVAVALVLGSALSIWQAVVAGARAEEAAAERDLARVEAQRAEAATERAERINAFLQSVLETSNPSWYVPGDRKGPSVTVLDALEDAAARMDEELADDPLVRADIHMTLGDTYRALFDYDRMARHFEASLALRRGALEAPHPKIAEALYYASTAVGLGGEYARAETLLRDAVEMQRRRDEGENLPFMLLQLSTYATMRGDAREALELSSEATELFTARHGPSHPYYRSGTRSMSSLAKAHATAGDLSLAGEWARAALERREDAHGLWALAVVQALEGRMDEAEQTFRRALELTSELPAEPMALREDFAALVLLPTGRHVAARDELTTVSSGWLDRSEGRPIARHQRVRTLAPDAYARALEGDVVGAVARIDEAETQLTQVVRGEDRPYSWRERAMLNAARGRIALRRGDGETARELFASNYAEIERRGDRGHVWHVVHADLAAAYHLTGDEGARDRHAALARPFGTPYR